MAALALAGPVLFVINGTLLARGTIPRSGHAAALKVAAAPVRTDEVSIVAFNIAKGFAYLGRGRFDDGGAVARRLGEVAEIVRREAPDFLFLSEVAWEAGRSGINQVTYLAEHTGLTNWVFGENVCFGFPGYRLVSGNAILSRGAPPVAVANSDLPGRRPFHVTRNNRRVLMAEAALAGATVALFSVHNDSFVPTNNLAQARWILGRARGRAAVIAGDFNATPDSASMQAFRRSDRFAALWDSPPTIPHATPDRTIDYILAPAGWQLLRHRVLTNAASDHCAVSAVFRIPPPADPPRGP